MVNRRRIRAGPEPAKRRPAAGPAHVRRRLPQPRRRGSGRAPRRLQSAHPRTPLPAPRWCDDPPGKSCASPARSAVASFQSARQAATPLPARIGGVPSPPRTGRPATTRGRRDGRRSAPCADLLARLSYRKCGFTAVTNLREGQRSRRCVRGCGPGGPSGPGPPRHSIAAVYPCFLREATWSRFRDRRMPALSLDRDALPGSRRWGTGC